MGWLRTDFSRKELDEVIECYERKIIRCRQELYLAVALFSALALYFVLSESMVDWVLRSGCLAFGFFIPPAFRGEYETCVELLKQLRVERIDRGQRIEPARRGRRELEILADLQAEQ